MRIKVGFHLTGKDAEYARAFENHCYKELGITATLDELVRRVFMKFVYDSVVQEGGDGTSLANPAGDTGSNAVGAESTDRPAEAGQTDTLPTGS